PLRRVLSVATSCFESTRAERHNRVMPRASTDAPAARRADREIRVLLVVGDTALANTVGLTLQHGPYARRVVGRVADGKAAIEEWSPHLLIVDIDVEAGRAIQLIDDARAHGPTGVIALTRP